MTAEPPLTPTPNRLIFPMLDAMRTCWATQLAHIERPVCHLPIIWGDSPLPAQRCDCQCANGGHGEAWIRIVRFDLRDQMRTQNRSRMADIGCAPYLWELTVETGIWRCALTLDTAERTAPSDEEYDVHTSQMLNDSASVSRLWRCCEWLDKKRYRHQLDTLVPSGPSGGCVGAIGTGRIHVEDCFPCP